MQTQKYKHNTAGHERIRPEIKELRWSSMKYLLFVLCLRRWPIVGFLKQDLLHFTILQVVKLAHRIFSPDYQVDKNRLWSLTLDKGMLGESTQERRLKFLSFQSSSFGNKWHIGLYSSEFSDCYFQELLRVRPVLRNFLKARIYKVPEIIRPVKGQTR